MVVSDIPRRTGHDRQRGSSWRYADENQYEDYDKKNLFHERAKGLKVGLGRCRRILHGTKKAFCYYIDKLRGVDDLMAASVSF